MFWGRTLFFFLDIWIIHNVIVGEVLFLKLGLRLVCVYDGSAHEVRHKLRRAEASIDTAAVPRIAMDISAQGSGFPLEDGAATRRTLFLLR